MMRSMFFHLLAIVLLASCAPAPRPPVLGTADGTLNTQEAPIDGAAMPGATGMVYGTAPGQAGTTGVLQEPVHVAILVPQSGAHAAMGEALLQAAQLAVFDLNEPNFQLIPKDTKGTPEGARAAVDEAAREGVKLILGPLFSQEVEAAKTAAAGYGLSVIGFSTDWRQAGDNVYSMGVLPFGQAERIAAYAAQQGFMRVAVIAPRDLYGDASLGVFETTAKRYGITLTKVVRITPDGRDAVAGLQQLTGGQPVLQGQAAPFDAIFMPVGGQTIHMLASMLKTYGLASNRVRYLGTGLWDDVAIQRDANMNGALYAAPSPQIRAAFERNYQRIYGSTPPRLASIGYDSAALAIVLARNAAAQGTRDAFNRAALTNPNGFSGVDGIFRFTPGGLAERGMAVLQIMDGSARQMEAAPASFVGIGN